MCLFIIFEAAVVENYRNKQLLWSIITTGLLGWCVFCLIWGLVGLFLSCSLLHFYSGTLGARLDVCVFLSAKTHGSIYYQTAMLRVCFWLQFDQIGAACEDYCKTTLFMN